MIDELKTKLKEGVCTVTFTKIDGTERVMKCTLLESLLPKEDETTKPKKEIKVNPDILRVFDVEKNDWRSFRLAHVINWTV